MDRRRAIAGALAATALAAVVLLTAVPGVPAVDPAAPDSQTQPLADGCQRNPAGLLTFTSPEWVYVYRDPTVRVAPRT